MLQITGTVDITKQRRLYARKSRAEGVDDVVCEDAEDTGKRAMILGNGSERSVVDGRHFVGNAACVARGRRYVGPWCVKTHAHAAILVRAGCNYRQESE